MDVSGYSKDDLRVFSAVLDAAMAEAAERNITLPMALMTRRLFGAARWGERDPERLKAEVLGDTLHQALSAGVRRERVRLGQGFAGAPAHDVWDRHAAI